MRIGVAGCAGRMGRANLKEVLETPGATLAGGIEHQGSPALGQDLGQLAGVAAIGEVAKSDPVALIACAEALIEFSTPAATLAHAELCAEAACAHIIGTTGLSGDDERRLAQVAQRTVIVLAPNMSLGINLLLGLIERVAAALDERFDIEILEMHHARKVDAPSGTALALGRAAARGRTIELNQAAVRARDGITGPRQAGQIGFATLRGGDVVGEHRVLFAGAGERLELAHIATDRRIYARGAVHAALWSKGRAPGLYGMADVLGLA